VLTLIVSSIAHAFCEPYLDSNVDKCEQGALFGAVLLYLAGLVFEYEKEVCADDSSEQKLEACMSKGLEFAALLVIVGTAGMAIYTQIMVLRVVRRKTKIGLHEFLNETLEQQQQKADTIQKAKRAQADKQILRENSSDDIPESESKFSNPVHDNEAMEQE
jgi:hypothetical protein